MEPGGLKDWKSWSMSGANSIWHESFDILICPRASYMPKRHLLFAPCGQNITLFTWAWKCFSSFVEFASVRHKVGSSVEEIFEGVYRKKSLKPERRHLFLLPRAKSSMLSPFAIWVISAAVQLFRNKLAARGSNHCLLLISAAVQLFGTSWLPVAVSTMFWDSGKFRQSLTAWQVKFRHEEKDVRPERWAK